MKYRTLKDVAHVLGYPCSDEIPFRGFAVDSREATSKNIFIALKGSKSNGHQYLGDAAKKGIAAAIVEKSYDGETYGIPILRVKDTLSSLHSLAKYFIESSKYWEIVGVTGSVGKTTVKDFTATLLKAKYRVFATPGNANSQVGLPLALLNHVFGDEDILVLEMGMSLPGEISRLIRIAPPTIAFINNVELVHASGFFDLHAIAKAKSEILLHPKTRIGIVSTTSNYPNYLLEAGECKKRTFGLNAQENDYYLMTDHLPYTGNFMGAEVLLKGFPFPGLHQLHNFLGAAAIAHSLGIEPEEIMACIPYLKTPPFRQEKHLLHGVTFVNDSYNASEVSVKAALESLPEPMPGGKRWALLGEMLELGKFSKEAHENVGHYSLSYVDGMFCLGEGCAPIFEIWKRAGKPVRWSTDRKELVEVLKKVITPGDVVLVKGSNFFKLWEVIEEMTLEK